jgi:hypothetical protein
MSMPISWLPRWVDESLLESFEVATVVDAQEPQTWRCHRPRIDSWTAIAHGLRAAHQVLLDMPISEIVRVIDRVAASWCDPAFGPRLAARAEVVRATGFSPEVVDTSFDVELRNYRAESLWRVLDRELGSARVLDTWEPEHRLPGCTRALGPEIVLEVLTGNVPGLPALSLVRALLVKSAVITKVASGEPTFAARFVATLADADPRLGDAIVCTYWARHEDEVRDAVLDHADTVIAYGGDDACAQMRRACRPHQNYIEHGHKLSVGVVSRAYHQARGQHLYDAIARDVSVFNQHACIAPQVYFFEATATQVREEIGVGIAAALERYAERTPLGQVSPRDAAAIHLHRASDMWMAATNDSHDAWHARGLDWTVRLASTLSDARGGGNRYLTLIPISEPRAALDHLRPFGRYLQNVGLGVVEHELMACAEAFARLGACRISEPGRMAEPSMMWRHDGRMCVAELVRWCDIEMHDQFSSRLLSDLQHPATNR